MEKTSVKCPIATNTDSRWPYNQYYLGDKDQDRRNGRGENHWSGAKSLEWYAGKFVQDSMHGEGEYRWRYKGPEGTFITYEGYFYGNRMHGYGLQSYLDGRVFNGLFYNNMRWGPGIETNTYIQNNVGLWRGNQLVRLAWRPKAPSVALDFNSGPAAQAIVEPHRTLLIKRSRNIGEVNSAIELLKQSGAEPIVASENWAKLYPYNCNDLASQMCFVELFDHEYYKNKILELEEIDAMPPGESPTFETSTPSTYYAWNNSDMLISMMKHCFKHETQREKTGIDLLKILAGRRDRYKCPGKHEYDSRNLIMCSYLGHILKVAQLINEDKVHPDVSDILGNTALMYATCGNQTKTIHFLVEAGANVNSFNDSCCTPLAVALIKFACLCKEIPSSAMLQALLPPSQVSDLSIQEKPSEWLITRELPSPDDTNLLLTRNTSKNKLASYQKSKGSATILSLEKKKTEDFSKKKKTNALSTIKCERNMEEERKIIPEENFYNDITAEYLLKVTGSFFAPAKPDTVPYLFETTDMTMNIEVREENTGKRIEKIKQHGTIKGMSTIKPSQDLMWHSSENEALQSSVDKMKIDLLEKTLDTITQLLADGADPRLVRCPKSALWIAVTSGSSALVRKLVQKGADVKEVYPDAYHYSILDMAISRPFTEDNLTLIRTILESGGTADHKLKCKVSADVQDLGPTLLHAVLAKHIETSIEEEICGQILELLLQYNANPLHQFMGVSATDMAMMKSLNIFDIFVRSSKKDLNAIINDTNQTMLSKMFSIDFFNHNPIEERLQTLTNLLLYGADPLLECREYEKVYENIFVYAKRNLSDLEPKNSPGLKGSKSDGKVSAKPEAKAAKSEAKNTGKRPSNIDRKRDDKASKPPAKLILEDIADYKQAIDLVKNCTRILYMRWIQANLLKELLGVVEKYEHRAWNMILPEHRNKIPCGLWLSLPRCLQIWDILKAKQKQKVVDRRILKHMLCMIHFFNKRAKTSFKLPLSAEEKGAIESEVCCLLREHKLVQAIIEEGTAEHLSRPYVTPELTMEDETKFKVCFECVLPLPENKLRCSFCKQISFCSLECMKMNVEQNVGIHPCSDNLKSKYFPSTTVNSSSLSNVN